MSCKKVILIILMLFLLTVALDAKIFSFEKILNTKKHKVKKRRKTGKLSPVKLHFTTNVAGQSGIDVFANPIKENGSQSVRYDVSAAFVQNKMRIDYTLVNGALYVKATELAADGSLNAATATVVCLDPNGVHVPFPEINSIVAAINDATSSDDDSDSESDDDEDSDGNGQCSLDDTYTTALNGADYTICASETGFNMQSKNMTISVEYMTTPVAIQSPNPELLCPSIILFMHVTKSGRALLSAEYEPEERKRRLRSVYDAFDNALASNMCLCKSKPRPCVFVHGQGIAPEMADNQDSFPHYWGNLDGQTPCCSRIKYVRLDTINTFWTSAELQQKTCSRVFAVSNSSTTTTIKDTIVVAHSMGNLMFAGAISNGLCKLDSSSTWVALSAPMKGSMASDFVQRACDGNANVLVEHYAKISGKCPVKNSVKSLAYEGKSYSSKELDAAYKAAQNVYRNNVYAAICGESASGVVSTYQWKFWLIHSIIPQNTSKNDGVVDFESCAAGFPESKFGTTYRDRFYKAQLNHFDTQFLAGDSHSNEAKMPVKWFACLL